MSTEIHFGEVLPIRLTQVLAALGADAVVHFVAALVLRLREESFFQFDLARCSQPLSQISLLSACPHPYLY